MRCQDLRLKDLKQNLQIVDGREMITNYKIITYSKKFKNYENAKNTIVGILAIQGSFIEHKKAIESLGIDTVLVKTKSDFDKINALILPGGESTTMYSLIKEYDLENLIIDKIKQGMPVYGTCAGMILLSRNIFKLIDIEVDRNAYGGQLDSFQTEIKFQNQNIEAIFIRAPKIIKVGNNVEVLAKFQNQPVLVRQNNILVSSFHPELTDDTRVYGYFIKMFF